MIKRYKKHIGATFVLSFLLMSMTWAQDVLRLEPYSENQLGLVEQILADTTEDGLIPDGRIYELDGGATYLNMQVLYVEASDTLHIRSNSEEKAIIYQYPTGEENEPPGYLFRSRGGDMILEGLAITGYFEPDDEDNPEYPGLYSVQGGLLRTDNEGANITLKDNIFSNIAGQVLRTEGNTKTIRLENNILANLGANSTSNFGAGKGIDLRETSVDSLILINNTFVNYQDRPIRHYNWGDPEAGTGEIGYGLFDHNTFVNGMGFHGVLSLGTVGAEITITNNLFLDAFAAGEDSTDETRTFEWGNVGETYANDNNKMSWIFAAPNETTEWTVNNNHYAVSAEGQAWFDKHDEITVGNPLSGHTRSRLGDAADDAFNMIDDPQMANIPDLMTGLMDYYVDVAGKEKDTPNDTWDPEVHDMDRRPITYYVGEFDASYSTESPAFTGSEGGYPAGDLNWFPESKEAWVNGDDPVSNEYKEELPGEFKLIGNYPNPFNPTTKISYQLARTAEVQLEVYDILGQKVATLLSGQRKQAGEHTINFNATNLSSGVYFYMLKAGDVVHTKKMTLIK